MDYSKAVKQVVENRRLTLDKAASLKALLIDTDTGFYENEKALRLAEIKLSRGEKADKAALLKERAAILARHSLTDADLNPPPACKECGDTGYSGGRICRCAVKIALESKETAGLPVRTFDDFDINIYSEKSRGPIKKLKDKLTKYVDTFPAEGLQNLIFLGRPGSGKTFCASVVAGEIMRRGFSVASMTAFGFIEAMRAYHTTFDESKDSHLTPLLDCDLLIIDDLGTESVLKNITLEYLYLVLNERMMSRKHTLITTNLAPEKLAARYGERTASRLFDKRLAYVLPFPDEDLRDALKRKQ